MELRPPAKAVVGALLLATATAGHAQDEAQGPNEAAEGAYTPAYGTCMDASGGVTLEMLNCMAAEMKIQDGRLNANYQRLLKATPAARQEQLKKVQRAWVSFRDLNCDFYVDPDGGSIVQVTFNGCLLEMTALRADQLSSLLPPE